MKSLTITSLSLLAVLPCSAARADNIVVRINGDRVYFLQREREQTRDKIGVVVGWRALVR